MVESEIDKMEELLKLTRDSNKILHAMRRHQRWASVGHALYWLLIVGVSVGSYVLIKPYLQTLMETYDKITEASNSIQDMNFSNPFSK